MSDNELEQVGYINNYNGDANRIYSEQIARTLKSEAGGGGAKTGWYAVSEKPVEELLSNPDYSYCIDANYAKGIRASLDTALSKCCRQLVFDGGKKYRIRKLTEHECWRLMGMTDEDCDAASAMGVSRTNLYKQAGNGIITNCISLIMEHLYKAQYDQEYRCYDENFH